MTPAALFIGNLVDSKGYKFLTLSDIDLLLVNKTKYNYDHVVLTYDVKDKLKYKRDLSKYKYYVDSLRPTYINFIVPIKNTREQEIIRNYLESNVVNLYTEEELSRYNITNKIVLNANKNIQSPEFIKKFTKDFGEEHIIPNIPWVTIITSQFLNKDNVNITEEEYKTRKFSFIN